MSEEHEAFQLALAKGSGADRYIPETE